MIAVKRDPLVRFLKGFMIISLLFLSCEEELPPYSDPTRLFEGELDGIYILQADTNYVRIALRMKNVYDETLDGIAKIDGQIRIVAKRDTTVKRTFSINTSMLVSGRYDSRTGRLIVDPNEVIRFETTWDGRDEAGRHLRSTFFVMVPDTNCIYRCFAVPEDFLLSATVNLYERIPAMTTGMFTFRFCYVYGPLGPPCPLGMLMPCDQRTPQLGSCPLDTFPP
jgi:hypothetical protein